MAQQQPLTGGKVEPMSNITYDLVTELSQEAQSVDVLNQYIDDARRENNTDVLRIFEQIRNDEMRHCDMLKRCIENQVKSGKF